MKIILAALILFFASETKASNYPAVLEANLNKHYITINSEIEQAQDKYNIARLFYFAGNFAEAAHWFKDSIIADENCAICYLGLALNLRSEITKADSDKLLEAERYVERALNIEAATKYEIDLAKAISERYTSQKIAEMKDRDRDFSQALSKLVRKYPEDPDLPAFYAESLMQVASNNYGQNDLKPDWNSAEILKTLATSLKMFPDHPGSNKLYINAISVTQKPEYANDQAERFGNSLVKGIALYDYLPATIYFRTGRFHDASLACQKAKNIDEEFFLYSSPSNNYYINRYLQNVHFLITSIGFEARSKMSLQIAKELKEKINQFPTITTNTEIYNSVYYLTLAKFGLWNDILKSKEPKETLPFTRSVWQYVNGLANIRSGNKVSAQRNLQEMAVIGKATKINSEPLVSKDLQHILGIYFYDLEAQILEHDALYERAAQKYQLAISMQDNMRYHEPPLVYISMRDALGKLYLKTQNYNKAENIYKQNLQVFPKSPWSLTGLKIALDAQGKLDESKSIIPQIHDALRYADMEIGSSRL